MTPETQVQIIHDGESTTPITILHGKALEPLHPRRLEIKGHITCVAEYLQRFQQPHLFGINQQAINQATAIIICDRAKMKITFDNDPNDTFGTVIIGSLEISEELEAFNIIKPKEYNTEEFKKLLRYSKRHFAEPDKYNELLAAYQKLRIKTSSELNNQNDNRGNVTIGFEKVVDGHNIPNSFVLNLPLFKGQKKELFRVEICISVTEASARFWLESPELFDLIEERKNEIFEEQIKPFKNDFIILNV